MKLIQLNEAINYNQMFDKKFEEFIHVIYGNSEPKKIIDLWVNNAKKSLKRQDRIVWFLRLVKLIHLAQGDIAIMLAKKNDQSKTGISVNLKNSSVNWGDYIDSEYQKYNSKTKADKKSTASLTNEFWLKGNVYEFVTLRGAVMDTLNPILDSMEHYLSLEVSKINNYVFEWQKWSEINRNLSIFENEWIESRKGTIPLKETDDIFLDTGNGWYWVNLNKSYCKEEGQAMGHCGNAPMGDHPDITVISLRQKKDDKKLGKIWKPYVTAIFNKKTGMFGEIKGRGNEKPREEFHPQLIKLMNDKRVKGIEGGGYAPERNFSITDLPDATWKAMVKKKPYLIEDSKYLNLVSTTDDRATGIIKKEFSLSHDGKLIILHEYDNIYDMLKYWLGNENKEEMRGMKWAADIFQGNAHLDFYGSDNAWDMITSYYLEKNEREYLDSLEESENDDDQTKFEELKQELKQVYRDAEMSGTESDIWDEFKSAVDSPLQDGDRDDSPFELLFDKKKWDTETKVSLVLPTSEIQRYLSDNDNDLYYARNHMEDEIRDLYFDFNTPHYGFQGFDKKYFEERKKEILGDMK